MSEGTDAKSLIRFPARDDDRLRLALRRLEHALEAQARAMAGFRSSMGELSSAVGGLEAGVNTYRQALSDVGEQVDRTRQAALTLEDRATRWLN